MMKHEFAVMVIEEAKATVTEIKNGADTALAAEMADVIEMLMSDAGEDANVLAMIAHVVREISDHPVWEKTDRLVTRALGMMDQVVEQARQENAEEWLFADTETASSAADVNNEDDWHEPTAEELEKADQDAALDDAYDAAYEELDDLKTKTVESVWEYEYGDHKTDDDAEERLSELETTLKEVKAALNKIEDAMYRYNKGWMEYWDADHAIFMATNEL